MGLRDFLCGMVAAAVVFSTAWMVSSSSARTRRIFKKRAKRHLRNNSLASVLGQAMDMSGSSAEPRRAMIVIARGEELTLDFIDPRLISFLGFTANDELPRTVYDLLPQSMIQQHRLWVSSAIRARTLPPRLQHPLRSVEVRHASGFFVRMDLKITWSSEATKEPNFHLLFAQCAGEPQSPYPSIEDVRVGDQIEYEEAVVVLLDIVEFTKECSQMSAVEVLAWMKHVRHAIEDVLIDNGLRLIETRGDNYLAIATPDGDGPSPAARAVDFAARASRAVAEPRGTRIRVGLAQGHVTVAALRCMGRREVLCLFGDVVNVAGRLEQAADPDHILVGDVVARTYAAERGLPPPPLRDIAAKGKPDGVRCARFDWHAAAFVDHGWPPPPNPPAVALPAAEFLASAVHPQRHPRGLSMLDLDLPRSASSSAALGRSLGSESFNRSLWGVTAPLGPTGGLQRSPSARGDGPQLQDAKPAGVGKSSLGDDGSSSSSSSSTRSDVILHGTLEAAARLRR